MARLHQPDRRRPLGALAAVLALTVAPGAAASERPAAPTDQIGVPGAAGGWEITPEGSLYGPAAEVTWSFGPRLAPWAVSTRSLAEGRLPVVLARRSAGGVTYELSQFATGPARAPVVVAVLRVRNPGRRTLRARWSASVAWTRGRRRPDGTCAFRFHRPAAAADFPGGYAQPGEAFLPGAAYAWEGRVLRRDGRALLLAARGAALRATARPQTEDGEGARAEWDLRVGPGAERRLTWVMPLVPAASPPASLDGARAENAVRARWRGFLSRSLRVRLPDSEVADTFDASLVNLALGLSSSAYGPRQTVNLLNYHASWLRDTAAIAEAEELAGLRREAAGALALLPRFQAPEGLFLSRPEQYDGWGQALWALAEHVRRGAGAAYARNVLPEVSRAMEWLAAQRARDSYGLLPVNGSHDNEDVTGHRVGDDLWAVMGAEGARDIARAAGDPVRAERYRAAAFSLRARVRAAALAAAAQNRGVLPPALDAPGGHDWGNLWLAWPGDVFAPTEPLVTATLAATRKTWREGIATYGRSRHGYLGFRVLETELERGEQARVIAGLRAHLAHATSTHGGCEFCGLVGGSRAVADNLTPHGWWAAEYVTLLRNMLVREAPGGLRVLSALPPS